MAYDFVKKSNKRKILNQKFTIYNLKPTNTNLIKSENNKS